MIEIKVYCKCGNELVTENKSDRWDIRIDAAPCDECLDSSYDSGFQDGKEEASGEI